MTNYGIGVLCAKFNTLTSVFKQVCVYTCHLVTGSVELSQPVRESKACHNYVVNTRDGTADAKQITVQIANTSMSSVDIQRVRFASSGGTCKGVFLCT